MKNETDLENERNRLFFLRVDIEAAKKRRQQSGISKEYCRNKDAYRTTQERWSRETFPSQYD